MTRASAPRVRRLRRQRGIAALELAFILPFILVLLPFPLVLGRAFWHYTVLQKAAYDAARFMATVPAMDMKTRPKGRSAETLAKRMMIDATADLHLDPLLTEDDISIQCDNGNCGGLAQGKPPAQVSVFVTISISDDLFPDITNQIIGSGIDLTAYITMPYIYVVKPIN